MDLNGHWHGVWGILFHSKEPQLMVVRRYGYHLGSLDDLDTMRATGFAVSTLSSHFVHVCHAVLDH
jgi:hypothetical protein